MCSSDLSYMAVPFLDRAGNILGHLAVFDERPMPADPRRGFILRIFAARATAEQERMRAEQRLRASEARFRDLFENAPNAYLVVGTNGRRSWSVSPRQNWRASRSPTCSPTPRPEKRGTPNPSRGFWRARNCPGWKWRCAGRTASRCGSACG